MGIGLRVTSLASAGKQVLENALEQSKPSSVILIFMIALTDENISFTVFMLMLCSINQSLNPEASADDYCSIELLLKILTTYSTILVAILINTLFGPAPFSFR